VAIGPSAKIHGDLNARNAFHGRWLERTELNLIHFIWGWWANSHSQTKRKKYEGEHTLLTIGSQSATFRLSVDDDLTFKFPGSDNESSRVKSIILQQTSQPKQNSPSRPILPCNAIQARDIVEEDEWCDRSGLCPWHSSRVKGYLFVASQLAYDRVCRGVTLFSDEPKQVRGQGQNPGQDRF